MIGLTHEARSAYVKLVAEFESESKRIEESSTSSSSSRKTSFESSSEPNSRKTSSQSDSDVIGSSFLSVSAAEFVPIATGLPPPPPPPSYPQYIPAPPPPLPYQVHHHHHHQNPYVVSSPIYHVPGSHSGYVPYGFPLVYPAPNVDAMGSGLIEVVPAPAAECPSLSDETAPASVQSSDV